MTCVWILGFVMGLEAGTPVKATVTLTHLAPDRWRVAYQFQEAIDALELGPPIAQYRKEAWRVLTPGIDLQPSPVSEVLKAEGAPFRHAEVEVRAYHPFSHDHYVPMNHFSDGGTAVYLGHLIGEARMGGVKRPLKVRFKVIGLPGERVLLPRKAQMEPSIYAYFGPQEPVATGQGRLLLDPQTPPWMRDVLLTTVSRITSLYAQVFRRTPKEPPLVLLAIRDLDLQGYSMKGGALPGQLVYRLAGNEVMVESPEGRRRFAQLIAHELAHVWQMEVRRGGIGEKDPWVHEGGAEAIALAALVKTGLWSQEEADHYAAALLRECEETQDSWRIAYACGFKRFQECGMNALDLWRELMKATERDGKPYSEGMIQDLLRVMERP